MQFMQNNSRHASVLKFMLLTTKKHTANGKVGVQPKTLERLVGCRAGGDRWQQSARVGIG